ERVSFHGRAHSRGRADGAGNGGVAATSPVYANGAISLLTMEPGSAFACHLPVASIEPPKERKRLLGPGDNLPGAFQFVELPRANDLLGLRYLRRRRC